MLYKKAKKIIFAKITFIFYIYLKTGISKIQEHLNYLQPYPHSFFF